MRSKSKNKFGIIRIVAVVAVMLPCFAGCRSVRYVPVESVRTDSIHTVVMRVDSVVERDSVFVELKGDTVRELRIKYQYRQSAVHDTVMVARTDTIYRIVETERKLTRWENLRMQAGLISLILLGLILLLTLCYGKIKKLFGK